MMGRHTRNGLSCTTVTVVKKILFESLNIFLKFILMDLYESLSCLRWSVMHNPHGC